MSLFGTPSEHFDAENKGVLAVEHQKLRLWARCHLQRWGNAGPAMFPVIDLAKVELGVTDKGKAVLSSIAAGSTSVLGAVAASLPFGASSPPICPVAPVASPGAGGHLPYESISERPDSPTFAPHFSNEMPDAPPFAPLAPAAPLADSNYSAESSGTSPSCVTTVFDKEEQPLPREDTYEFGDYTRGLIAKVKCALKDSNEDDVVFPAFGDEPGDADVNEDALVQPQPCSTTMTYDNKLGHAKQPKS